MQAVRLGQVPLEARIVHALADFGLNIVDGVPEGLGYGLAPQTLHVEIVGFGGKDEEHNHGFVRSRLLEGMVESRDSFDEDISALVTEFVPSSREEVESLL